MPKYMLVSIRGRRDADVYGCGSNLITCMSRCARYWYLAHIAETHSNGNLRIETFPHSGFVQVNSICNSTFPSTFS